jgi:Raf kinase inhibitor-like YbhB/YbcL family protein
MRAVKLWNFACSMAVRSVSALTAHPSRRITMKYILAATAFALTIATPASAHAQKTFTLSSAEVPAGSTIKSPQVASSMGCTGNNTSPSLSWRNAPANAKSFALTMYDPDAPTGSGWWHWVVYNIPASTLALPAGAGDPQKNLLPSGAVQGNTDIGAPGYMGPCPPPKDKPHRYIFTLYALDTDKLDLPANATAAYVGFNIHGHTVGKATFTAKYGR